MPWTASNTINSMKKKSLELRELFAEVANAVLADGGTESEAVEAGLAAVSKKEGKVRVKKAVEAKPEPSIPPHLAAILALKAKQSEQQEISKAVKATTKQLETISEEFDTKVLFKQKNRLEPDSERSLVGVEWDREARLVLKFDDGEKLVSEPVPVNAVSSSVIVSGGGSTPTEYDFVQFNTDADVTPVTEGMLTWSKDQETLVLGQGESQHYLGLDLQVHVRNSTASTIAKGTPVMAVGTLGASGRILVAPMDGTNPNNYKFLIGVTAVAIAAVAIAAGADGKVVSFGKIRQVNLNAYQDGDVLWISTTQVGKFTNIEPTSGLKMPVAFVVHAANNGTMMTRITPIDENKFLAKSFETVSKNLDSSDATYSYTTGLLTQISYANGVVKQLNYNNEVLTSVSLSGSTPAGIELTKTFTYQNDELVGTTYSRLLYQHRTSFGCQSKLCD